ncbi:NlpC/P60 family protein [Streptomyces hainanensis]|uniref:NlpC/P60 domain-containing protein n=1 Tax=Streptomyces hainanensis TaxID=402648 RepID=A0A4R4SNY6_9ACTN|nr:C40 family peptidase [Streptomyces hainanensis]TDC65547.1 hypothetical protein E1283_30550 [Streptomyces hainanensis]
MAARFTMLTAATAAAMSAAPVLAAPAVPAAPPADSVEAAREVDRLFTEAERAIEAYNGAAERVEALEAELARSQERLARGQQLVNDRRHAIGATAAAHYRAGGIDPTLVLLLSDDPEHYLDKASALERAAARGALGLRELRAAQRGLERRRTEADDRLTLLSAEKDELSRHKRTAQRRLAAARRQYERLSARERADRERAAREGARVPTALATLHATVDDSSEGPGAARATAAVAAARGAVGRPYAWGQAGPSAFDCSGLIQWAYAQAGVSLPRTSQGQATAGRRVTLAQARPGDIVVYRADASHVGLYVGGGQIVHAPYPGSTVRYEGVGMMPVSSVVRP